MRINQLVLGILTSMLVGLHSFEGCAQDKKQDIYILIGQSNMAGRGQCLPEDLIPIEGVYLLNERDHFEIASNPLNKYSTIRKTMGMQKLGPGYSFCKILHAKLPNRSIGLIVNARGGSSITEWQPGGKYLEDIISRAKKAKKYGRIKGVLWHQGESDQNTYQEYEKQFKSMANHIRKALHKKQLPFFIGELGKWRNSTKGINSVLDKLSKTYKNVYLIRADELYHRGDNTHFSRESQLLLGERYAGKVLEIIY
ncbi:sialate O-acetylesterase [Puteibacter caeruleilacunae]|nr:sialate O-acetylesterase [Puteibacter caeruleilacunae]